MRFYVTASIHGISKETFETLAEVGKVSHYPNYSCVSFQEGNVAITFFTDFPILEIKEKESVPTS